MSYDTSSDSASADDTAAAATPASTSTASPAAPQYPPGAGNATPAAAAAPFNGMYDGPVATATATANASNPLSRVEGQHPLLAGAMDTVGKGMDMMGWAGGLSALPSIPNDIASTANGVKEMVNGDYKNGAMDTATGALGVVGDAATMMGAKGIADPTAAVKGVAEMSKGGGQVLDSIFGGDAAPGQQAPDRGTEATAGISNILAGAADATGALPGQAGKLGKAGNFGLGVGATAAGAGDTYGKNSSVFGTSDDGAARSAWDFAGDASAAIDQGVRDHDREQETAGTLAGVWAYDRRRPGRRGRGLADRVGQRRQFDRHLDREQGWRGGSVVDAGGELMRSGARAAWGSRARRRRAPRERAPAIA